MLTTNGHALGTFTSRFPFRWQVDGRDGARRTDDSKFSGGCTLHSSFVICPGAAFQHPEMTPHSKGPKKGFVPVLLGINSLGPEITKMETYARVRSASRVRQLLDAYVIVVQ